MSFPTSGLTVSEHHTTRADRLASAIVDLVLRQPWLIILVTLILVLFAGSGLRFIEFSTNYRVFFSPQNPELVAFEDFQRTYTKNDNILFTLKPERDATFSPRTVEAIEALTQEAWQIPYAIRVDSVSNFQHSWADGDTLTVEDLVRNGASLPQTELDRRRAIAVAEPLLFGKLLARDVGATAINVTLQYPEQHEAEVPEAVAVARSIAADIERRFPDITIAISGVSMLNNAFAEAGNQDAMTLIPSMYLILLLAMILTLRSASGTAATLLVVLFSMIIAVGLTGHAGIRLDPISVLATIVIMTLAVADSIHILVTMLTLMGRGRSQLDALRDSIRINFLPVLITSITTVVGFMSLNFSDAPPFQYLGNITAVGIAAAWILSLTFLPAVLSLAPMTARAGAQFGPHVSMGWLARLVTSRYKAALWGTGALALLLMAMLPRVELNDQWVEYFDHRVEFRNDTDFTTDHLSGIYVIEHSINGHGPEGINDPVYLEHVDQFTAWLRAQPEVDHVYSYTDIIKRLNKNMHEDDPAWYRLPDSRHLAGQYLFLYEISLPFGLDLTDRITVDKSATRVSTTLKNITTAEVRAFLTRTEAWLTHHTPAYMWAKPTSATVMFSFISQRNIEGMFMGNLLAVGLIGLILMVSLRSVGLGALSLIPNVLPILMAFGLWGLLVGQVGMAAATVSATALGIVVDSTVHFLTKYLRARRQEGLDKPAAIEYAFNTVGLAILLNTIILASGFLVLAFSTFKVNVEMGVLTAITIMLALIIDFLFLPALLMLGHTQQRRVHHADTELAPTV